MLTHKLIDRWIHRWILFVFRRPWPVALALIVVTGFAWLEAQRFSVDSDNYKLIRQAGAWFDNLNKFLDTFPELRNVSYVVVESASAEQTYRVSKGLTQQMQTRPDLFQSVFAPQQSTFMLQHSLYFEDLETLQAIADRAVTLEPVLTELAASSSLVGLVAGLEAMLATAPNNAVAPGDLVTALLGTAQSIAGGEEASLNWRQWLIPPPASANATQILFQGVKDFTKPDPNKEIIDAFDVFVAELQLSDEVTVRLTGDVALEYDEIRAARDSVKLAGTVSLVALAVILVLGVRSLRIILAIYLALALGLLWTVAFATRFIGAFNTISIVFVVMFIGLGMDFSIHYCMRAQEEFGRRGRNPATLAYASGRSWFTILLCAATTAMGFLAFAPTDYRGLAELGMISAAGMFLALLSTYSVIPTFFALVGLPTGRVLVSLLHLRPRLIPTMGRASQGYIRWMYKHNRSVVTVALMAAIACTLTLPLVRFDFSTLGLKDPATESMQTLRDLQTRNVVTDYTLALLVPADKPLGTLAAEIAALPSVAEVVTPDSVVPQNQLGKQTLMRAAKEPLKPGFGIDYRADRLNDDERLAALDSMDDLLRRYQPEAARTLETLRASLGSPEAQRDLAGRWEQAVLDNWPDRFTEILGLLSAKPFNFGDLPEDIRKRLVSEAGDQLVTILPEEGYAKGARLRQFISEAQSLAPGATGRLVSERETARMVLNSLYQAVAYALAGLGMLLLVTLRRPLDVLLVLFPILLGVLFTAATMAVFGLPLNMANVLVIPLIFGLGLDGTLHILKRFRESRSLSGLLRSSTPWAVFLSYLTTLVTFGSLAVSSHQGMSSMGLLLFIALSFTLFTTIDIFAALLHWIDGRPEDTDAGNPDGARFSSGAVDGP